MQIAIQHSVRIITGLILYFYAGIHLINAALGLHSIEMMDMARPWMMWPWSTSAGSFVLLASLLVHAGLGLAALYRRNTLRMDLRDSVQLGAALVILPLLIPHANSIRMAVHTFDLPQNYQGVLGLFWLADQVAGLQQVLLIVAVWVHGSIGFFTWMQLRSWWPRVSLFVYPLAVAIPVAALLGFSNAGSEIVRQAETTPVSGYENSSGERDGYETAEPAKSDDYYSSSPATEETRRPAISEIKAIIDAQNSLLLWSYFGLLLLVLAMRQVRLRRANQTASIRIAGERKPLEGKVGLSLLEIMKSGNRPIANLCGGRARCATCRVRIISAEHAARAPSILERETLARAGADDGVRLACQMFPEAGDLQIERVLPVDVEPFEHKTIKPANDDRPGWQEAAE